MIENKNIQNSRQKKDAKPEEYTGIINKGINSNNTYTESKNIPTFEDPADNLLYNINYHTLLVNKLDFYGNSIPLGAFCFAISSIMYGFYECNVHNGDKFLYIIILLFGGFGQVTAGIFEYIKSRTFPSHLYLLYGIYYICLFVIKYPFSDNSPYNGECFAFFFGSWACLTFPLLIGSFHTNIFYLLQTFFVCAFFVVRCIGECYGIKAMIGIVSGILEIINGVISLYICFNQIINETLGFQLLPSFNLQKDNEIDLEPNKDNNN